MKFLPFFRALALRPALFAWAVALVASCAHAQAPAEIKGWGQWNDPDGDCTYKLEKEKLTVAVPAGAHDLSAEYVRMNAPTVLKEITGDFSLVVRVSGKFAPEGQVVNNRPSYQAAGLVVMLDNRNYLRLERAATRPNNARSAMHTITYELRLNGAVQRAAGQTDNRTEDTPLYLLIQRQGERMAAAVSKDGKEWQNLGEKNLTKQEKLKVGVTAINLSAVPFEPLFEEFQIVEMESQKPEEK
jgi:regulation of enolase protein 1 (concanavalin A-like superfamily)